MIIDVVFTEVNHILNAEFGVVALNQNNDEAYNKGYADGQATGYQEGFGEGKQAEYDTFWNEFQENGTRNDYYYAFAGIGWTDTVFNPKYDIVATGDARSMFGKASISDLKGIFEKNHITLNLSNVTNCQAMFANSTIKYLPEIDLSKCDALTQLFSYANELVSVDKLKVNFTGSGNGFANNSKLEHIIFDGVIGGTGLNLQHAKKLDTDSWVSLINALSSTTSGLTVTGSLASVQKAFETSKGANDGNTSAEWKALTDTKTNWTISLV